MLSYLVPGLGQIVQGMVRKDAHRLTKGVFFLIALLGMFFYGLWLGAWKTVFLPRTHPGQVQLFGKAVPPVLRDVWNRLPYAGQFWIGIAAWPALIHYWRDVGEQPIIEGHRTWLGSFQKTPPLHELNALQSSEGMGRLWYVAQAYTIIAGLLNILVIYHAAAGPMHPVQQESGGSDAQEPKS